MTEQGENIDAIERYISEQEPARTDRAKRVRDDFLKWIAGVNILSRELDPAIYDRVRNWKLDYNRANAATPEERAAVEEQAKRGLSTEELRGDPDRRQTDGSYAPAPTFGERFTPLFIGLGLLAVIAIGLPRRR